MGYQNQNHDTNKANLRLWFIQVRGIESINLPLLNSIFEKSQNITGKSILKSNIKKKLQIKVWL
jgi:hypothetical protein